KITISWKPADDAPADKPIPDFDLYFMTGGDIVQTRVAKIGTFSPSQREIPYTIPDTAPGKYFIMFVPKDGSSDGNAWTTRFSVNGGSDWYPEGVATGRDPSSDGSDSSSTSGGEDDDDEITDSDDSNDSETDSMDDENSDNSESNDDDDEDDEDDLSNNSSD